MIYGTYDLVYDTIVQDLNHKKHCLKAYLIN